MNTESKSPLSGQLWGLYIFHQIPEIAQLKNLLFVQKRKSYY